MSSRRLRVLRRGNVEPFDWDRPAQGPLSPDGDRVPAEAPPPKEARTRDTFAAAYAQGEKAGFNAGSMRAEAMLHRLASTLREMDELRSSMLQHTERQILQVALELARRVLRREVETDHDLLCGMARVALDRLGESDTARIRLHPEDHAALTARHGLNWAGTNVRIEADAAIARGGCLVESPYGFIDASVAAQFEQLERALTSIPAAGGQEAHTRAS